VLTERRTLLLVLAINAFMFVVELVLGLRAQSTGLIADSLDMLADASVYGLSLLAVGRGQGRQRHAARGRVAGCRSAWRAWCSSM
jgi:Co/Zn/Cd efflux system component